MVQKLQNGLKCLGHFDIFGPFQIRKWPANVKNDAKYSKNDPKNAKLKQIRGNSKRFWPRFYTLTSLKSPGICIEYVCYLHRWNRYWAPWCKNSDLLKYLNLYQIYIGSADDLRIYSITNCSHKFKKTLNLNLHPLINNVNHPESRNHENTGHTFYHDLDP